jgi:putative phosphoribosyl transferase
MRLFRDRQEAGRRLAAELNQRTFQRPLVVGLPRGGVPVAAQIARTLHAPLEVLVVRKLGHPADREFGVGALTEDGRVWLGPGFLKKFDFSREDLRPVIERERREAARRVRVYRGGRPPHPIHHREVILVDDGLATGVTAFAAIRYLREHGAARIVLAVPVAAPRAIDTLRELVDEVMCLAQPEPFRSVGAFYEDFHQVRDEEVLRQLAGQAELGGTPSSGAL